MIEEIILEMKKWEGKLQWEKRRLRRRRPKIRDNKNIKKTKDSRNRLNDWRKIRTKNMKE